METNTEQLKKVLTDYAVPDPKIVGKLPKGGTQLDFVGHADITRILIEIDPHWRLVPIAWENGRPAVNIVNDMATMWFEMTLLGQARLAIGTAKANAQDLDKVLYGDALRNGAMRFGIGLSLWTKQEWNDLDHYAPAPKAQPKQQPKPQPKQPAHLSPDDNLTEEQIAAFNKACVDNFLNPMTVYKDARVRFGFAKQSDLDALRDAWKAAKDAKAEAKDEG